MNISILNNSLIREIDSVQVSPVYAIVIFAILFGSTFLLLFFKKIYFYFIHKKRYYIIPRVSVQGMTNIAMTIAMAVSIIIIIMAITGGVASVIFRSYPGTRVTIEVILVKISGLLFGPIVGLISGACIDLLAVALSAGFFHYGYFLAAMLTGLIAGVIRSVITTSKLSKYHDLLLAIFSTLFLILSTSIVIAVFINVPNLKTLGFVVSLPGLINDLHFSQWEFLGALIASTILFIIIIWIVYIVQHMRNRYHSFALTNFKYRSYKHGNHSNRIWLVVRNKWYTPLISTITLAASAGLIVNVLFLPIFDAQITSQPYTFWVILRFFVMFFLIALDILVIYPVLLIIGPIVKYNYESELIEDLRASTKYENLSFKEVNMHNLEKIIIECSESLLFSLNENQLKKLKLEFNDIISQFEKVLKIDTTGLEPSNYPISISAHNLREDVIQRSDNIADIMRCPELVENGLVKVY
ncbi:hypothetical protein [Mycoplasmoides alvi]|uniref:hypothetical protein n=1 Tax=Mycoplasmoides alvi TaxID=78580 RepID=UPI000698D344|nr:hypothetical protein [Mycoplasmoides alvi]